MIPPAATVLAYKYPMISVDILIFPVAIWFSQLKEKFEVYVELVSRRGLLAKKK